MENLKKKQHYVWKHYLSAWTTNNSLACLLKKENKIITVNTDKVASKKFFYELSYLTKKEEQIFNYMFIDNYSDQSKKLNEHWLHTSQAVFELEKFFQNLPDSTWKQESLKEIEIRKKNLVENLFASIEGNAVENLKQLRDGDISFFEKEKDKVDFCIFVACQYFRTKRMQDLVVGALNDKNKQHEQLADVNWDAIIKMGRLVMMTNIGLVLYSNYRCVMLENNTSTPFITGDQPTVNMDAEMYHMTNGVSPKTLTIYYPVSPTKAILLTEDKTIATHIKVSENDVERYNNKIAITSNEQLYATSVNCLKRFEQDKSK